ncbi:MAG: Rap1a/Tai family immunity protein [Pseudomonadota bacterium]|nr:Rap1a/Tai family immunity protein [Pseudomonadota bacterium]
MKIKSTLPAALGAAFLASIVAQQAVGAVGEEDFALETTEDLYQICSATADDPNYIHAAYECRGFIEGAVQYHDAVSDKKHLKRLICYPESATIGDGKKAFVAWAKKHSGDKEAMGELPVVGLVRALADKYPCKR